MTFSIPRTYQDGSQTVTATAFNASLPANLDAIRAIASQRIAFSCYHSQPAVYFPTSGSTTWNFESRGIFGHQQGIFWVPWKNLASVAKPNVPLYWKFILGYKYDKVTISTSTDDRIVKLYYQELGSTSGSSVGTRTLVSTTGTVTRYDGPTGDVSKAPIYSISGPTPITGDTIYRDTGWIPATSPLSISQVAAYRASIDISLANGSSSQYVGDSITNAFLAVIVRPGN